ncbi:MAG: methylated-DNA--[protein]-cysteine S-methyltransferase [Betaproteobacteria bacterium]
MRYAFIDSPLGRVLLQSLDNRLAGLHFCDGGHVPPIGAEDELAPADAVILRTALQLAEYFEGRRRNFDIPLHLAGTPFQQSVWSTLREIPFGHTMSYGGMAARMGRPGAARAVGAANARNPVSILVPCHRAVGANGSLTGYSGGIDRKQALLEMEGAWRSPPALLAG